MDAVDRGIRVKRFLEDEAVVWALDEMRKDAYNRFRVAGDDNARIEAQSLARVIEGFDGMMRSVVGVGEREHTERERRERGALNSHE